MNVRLDEGSRESDGQSEKSEEGIEKLEVRRAR